MRHATESDLRRVAADLPPGSRIVCLGNFATPFHVLDIIDKALESYRLNILNAQPGIPDREGVIHETSFVGPAMRHSPRLRYVPARLSMLPELFKTSLAPDAVIVTASTPQEGKLSLGTEVNVLPAALESVRRRGGQVIAEINPRIPYTYGDAVIPTDMIDYAIEVDRPLASPTAVAIDGTAKQIGERVADRVADGATLQLGIGAIPNAALHGLAERRGLRIWSEMISDGVLYLNDQKALDRDRPIITSFMFGSQGLYEWADRNPQVRMLRTETTNDPSRIGANDLMVSINSALQVDLYGQVNASRVNGRIYSGFGGQTDFIVGALHSRGGQAVIALRSWHPKADCSTIVPMVDEPVTSFQPTAVITEQGTAEIFGRPEANQMAELIERAAHPRIRGELWEEAAALASGSP